MRTRDGLRRRQATTSAPEAPEEILEPSQQDAIVTELLSTALTAQRYQSLAVSVVLALVALYLVLVRPTPFFLRLLSIVHLLLSAVSPEFPLPQAFLLGNAFGIAVLGLWVFPGDERHVWAVMPVVIGLGVAVRESAKRTVLAARELEGMKYDAPEA